MTTSNYASTVDWIWASHDLNITTFLELEPQAEGLTLVSSGHFVASESRFLTREVIDPLTPDFGVWSDLSDEEKDILSAAFPKEED